MKILLTGGGTGGHIIPNLALVDTFREKGNFVAYMGGYNSLEMRLVKEKDLPFYPVTCVKFRRDKLLSNLAIPYLLFKGIKEARDIIKKEGFDLVFAKGGYVSLPACFAAHSLGLPVVTHESDSTLGLANRIISHFASLVITNNDLINCKAKHINLGNPVREKIFYGNKENVLNNMHYDPHKEFVLIVGGSSGAKAFNEFVEKNIDVLTSRYNILHITGRGNNHLSHQNYLGVEYAKNIEDFYDLADLIVSRSGAGAIAEILALRKKSILIPLCNKASRGDQLDNALQAEKDGLAIMLREDNLTIDDFFEALTRAQSLYKVDSYYDRDTPKKIVEATLQTQKN